MKQTNACPGQGLGLHGTGVQISILKICVVSVEVKKKCRTYFGSKINRCHYLQKQSKNTTNS